MNRNLFLFMLLFLFTITACVSEVAKEIHASAELNAVKADATTVVADKGDEVTFDIDDWTDEKSSLVLHHVLMR